MASLISKYDLGQTVYSAHISNEMEWHKCPDCDGSGYWDVVGKDKKVKCETCNPFYSNNIGYISKPKKLYKIDVLTIGQIRCQIGYEPRVIYMCKETGIGSGTLWYEETLLETKGEAEKLGQAMLDVYIATGKQPYINDFTCKGGK